MEQVYYSIAAIVYSIFIIRFIISWVGGEFEIDGDFDGDADLDVSDVVSFKGLTHFLMGASGWLSVKSWTTHNIMWWDYLIALALGIIFVIVLYFIYKLMMSLETKPQILTGKDLVGHEGKIYLCLGKEGDDFKYQITVQNGVGTMECTAKSSTKYYVGDMVTISDFANAYYII